MEAPPPPLPSKRRPSVLCCRLITSDEDVPSTAGGDTPKGRLLLPCWAWPSEAESAGDASDGGCEEANDSERPTAGTPNAATLTAEGCAEWL